jgi:DNA-binding HxlR family transcriptional regulator
VSARRPNAKSSTVRPHRHDEYCPISRALELVGDRWSLLIVVELLFVPKRYSDLFAALNGIGSNLLAARLKRLERTGVVRRRRLPAPAASTVYELTERGRLLEPVAYALGRFGLHYLEPLTKDATLHLEALLFGMHLIFKPASASGVDETYELHVDDRPVVHLRVRDNRLNTAFGEASEPAVVITTTSAALLGLSMRRLSPAKALSTRAVRLKGDRSAFLRFVSMFEMPVPGANAASRRSSRGRGRQTRQAELSQPA